MCKALTLKTFLITNDSYFKIMDIVFVECRVKDWEFTEYCKNELIGSLKEYKTVGLVSTVQYLDVLDAVEKFLEENNKTIKTAKSSQHAKYKGQILGCDVDSAEKLKSEVILYIGEGLFHPIGLLMKTEKPILALNPMNGKVQLITEEQVKIYRMRKAIAFDKLKHSEKIGILVSTKPGQNNLKEAVETKEKLEKKGKNVFIFMFDELQIDSLINFPDIDSWINTACPRMALEDAFRFRQSIINYNEIDWEKF